MSAVERIQGLLGTVIRVEVADGRLVQGELHCLDKDMNIVLQESVEYYGVSNGAEDAISEDMVTRALGMVMIPGRHVLRVLAANSSA